MSHFYDFFKWTAPGLFLLFSSFQQLTIGFVIFLSFELLAGFEPLTSCYELCKLTF